MPSVTPFSLHAIVVLVLAGATLLLIAFGRLPGFPLNRAAVAAAGAGFMAALQGMGPHALWRSIDGPVLLLLFSLMLVNAALAEAGLFRLLTYAVAGRRATRSALLVALVGVAGVLSALFLNDTVALMLTPTVIALARNLDAPPLPYLVALAMASNAGSLATITGNPQNVAIGLASGIGYLPFAAAMAPIALVSLFVVAGTVLLMFRRDLLAGGRAVASAARPATRPGPLALRAVVALGMLCAFVLGVDPAIASLVAASVLLVASGRRAGTLLRGIDYSLLVLFGGLFVVVGALGATPLAADLLAWASHGSTVVLALVAAAASNVLSNVPAVLLLLPAVGATGPTPALTLAMASTLAGNLTLVGSIANLIVAEGARRDGVEMPFLAHARVGVPVTVLTLALGTAMLALR